MAGSRHAKNERNLIALILFHKFSHNGPLLPFFSLKNLAQKTWLCRQHPGLIRQTATTNWSSGLPKRTEKKKQFCGLCCTSTAKAESVDVPYGYIKGLSARPIFAFTNRALSVRIVSMFHNQYSCKQRIVQGGEGCCILYVKCVGNENNKLWDLLASAFFQKIAHAV